MTTATREILSEGKYRDKLEGFTALKYYDKVTVDGVEASAHNAGHILGSAQYKIQDSESSIVYTGDINCREMLTTTAAEILPCDTLILETTYGNPSYIFPSLEKVHTDIVNWAIKEVKKGLIPTFSGYSVGKAQEIVKVFNEFTNIPVVVSNSIARFNEVYNKNGVKLAYAEAESEEGREILKQTCIQIKAPHEKSAITSGCSNALTTGWVLKFASNPNRTVFPLSSHADFNQLVNYVKLAKPKEVLTIHGFKKEFANYLSRKLGIRAREIQPIKNSLNAFL